MLCSGMRGCVSMLVFHPLRFGRVSLGGDACLRWACEMSVQTACSLESSRAWSCSKWAQRMCART